MKDLLAQNINAIEAGGGFVDAEWLESEQPAPDGATACINRAQSGIPNLIVTVKTRSTTLVFTSDDEEKYNPIAEKFEGMAGRHAVVYGLGAGRHVEEALRAVGESGEVTVFECSRLTARESLVGVGFEHIAALPNVRIIIGPGREVVPRITSRVRKLECAGDEIQTKLHVHKPSQAALPVSDHKAREFIRRIDGGFFIDEGQDNPLMQQAFYAIQKNIYRGGPLTDIEMAFLFAETVRENGRYDYFYSDYEQAPLPENVSCLLVSSPDAIGDAVSASAALPGLREKYPDARIVFLTEDPSLPLFKYSGLVDHVISFSLRGIIKEFFNEPTWKKLVETCEKFLKAAGELRMEKFDAVINTHQSERSALIAGMLDLPPERRIGYSIGRDGVGVVRGNIWQRLRVIGHAKLDLMREDNSVLMFEAPTVERRTGAAIPEGDDGPWALPRFIAHPRRGRVIGISPFVSDRTRNWGLDKYFALCKLIVGETNRDLVIFAGANKEQQEVAGFISDYIGARATLCAGQPLDRAAWGARECALFITNDTGPMHFAASAGARCLALLGPTLILPYSTLGHIGIFACLPCVNCFRIYPCKTMNCFEMIEPAHVAALASAMLESGPDGALSELSGVTGDDQTLGLITTGTYASLTPRYAMVLRGPDPHESNIAGEFARIAIFNVIHLLEAGALETGCHPRDADLPGLSSPFSPETAVREVMRRYSFVSPDPVSLKKCLDSQLEQVETARQSIGYASGYHEFLHPVYRFVRSSDLIEDSHCRDRALDLCAEFLTSVKDAIS